MILTKEFLMQFDSCKEGYRFGLEHDLIGKDYDYAISVCKKEGQIDHARWLEEQKHTEAFVRFCGEKIMVTAYKVFNPLLGRHATCNTEEEAKAELLKIAQEVLQLHCPNVMEEIKNESGDATWIATKWHENIKVSYDN